MFAMPIVDAQEARQQAQAVLPRLIFDYIDGAAGQEHSERENREALAQIKLRPRILQDVRQRDLSTQIFGQDYDLPFGIAPMGMCNLAWPGTDGMLARLGAKHNVPVGVSTVASSSLEYMWEHSQGRAWFQLYFSGNGSGTLRLAQRAQAAGYETLILTVDVPEVGRRPRDLKQGFKMPFRIGPRTFVDFALHPQWSLTTLFRGSPSLGNFTPRDAENGHVFNREESRAGTDWDWFKRLRELWQGKLVVKGVLDAQDALDLVKAGADAIQVSSHGGRQLNSAILPVRALPRIRQAVGPDFPVFFDSGARGGEDVAKLLALGADFVFFGRPLQFAAAAGQERGLNQYWDSLVQDLSITMAQLGKRSVAELNAADLEAQQAV